MNARRFGFLFALILVTVSCRKDDVPSGPDALPDTGLPVVCIDTEGGRAVESKAINYPASVKIIGAGVYDGLETAGCTVRGRGNTSWSWPKKPYRLDFPDRVPLLGMPAGRHWVLLANFPDRTLMRNLVAMKVASLTSLAWTPRCVPVLLIEKVEVDAERVDVSQDGGYLLESDFRFDNEVQWIDHHGISRLVTGIPFAIKYPSPDDLTRAQEEFVRQYVADAASALWSDGFEDPETGYAAWIDVDSFIDYWLVFEIMGNPELSNPCSVFYHMAAGGKLAAGPCWDFDICLRSLGTSVQEWTGFVNRYAVWYARLFKDPGAIQAFFFDTRRRIVGEGKLQGGVGGTQFRPVESRLRPLDELRPPDKRRRKPVVRRGRHPSPRGLSPPPGDAEKQSVILFAVAGCAGVADGAAGGNCRNGEQELKSFHIGTNITTVC